MRNLDYLTLLSKSFPNREAASAEIINLSAIMDLPKGTEYFFSDIHGEYEAFSYLMRSSSGVIRAKIKRAFGDSLPEKDQLELAYLIYYPQEGLAKRKKEGKDDVNWQKKTIERLIVVAQHVSSKYTRSKVRKKMPKGYAYALDELIHTNETDLNKANYHAAILDAICAVNSGPAYITALCELIQSLTMDHLHIVGDIFDRGPRADKVMDELMAFPEVDFQWGNHDVTWMGAACGNLACICNVLHIATLYNSFDVLEDGYGINLRPLSMYAQELYGDDPCNRFKPHLLDENISDTVEPGLAAKMCKVITMIMFKVEGQLIRRHPEYNLNRRLLLNSLDLKKGTLTLKGKTYELLDKNWPTFQEDDPRALSEKEIELLENLRYSFVHSEKLQRHLSYIIEKGAMYKAYNGNLLFHGCIPMNEDGSFYVAHTPDGDYSGKALLDYFDRRVREIFHMDNDDPNKAIESDLFWYLWCGPKSPLFGKDQITTFERIFLDDKSLYRELYDPYFQLTEKKEVVEKVLIEFGLNPKKGHIINGHVPVLVNRGESPIKAEGKLFRIDGGLSKSYQSKTGIAGYTLIFNSHHLAIAEHSHFVKGEENPSNIQIVEVFPERLFVKDCDIGKRLAQEVSDLRELIAAYTSGAIKERH